MDSGMHTFLQNQKSEKELLYTHNENIPPNEMETPSSIQENNRIQTYMW